MSKLSDYEIERNFIEYLRDKDLSAEKANIDNILHDNLRKPGSIVRALLDVQQIVKSVPVPVQYYIAKEMKIPASDVFGIVSFYSCFQSEPVKRK